MTFVCVSVVSFNDGGPDEAQVLARGTEDECQHVRHLVPAVAYRGDRPVAEATLIVWPASIWDSVAAVGGVS